MTPDSLCAYLNYLLLLDRNAIEQLFAKKVGCNAKLANHPSVQVGQVAFGYTVSLLGLLNGLFETWPDQHGKIYAEYDGSRLIKFGITDGARHCACPA